MRPFAWVRPTSVPEALGAGATPLAAAMLSESGEPGTSAVIFKAGGIDLLDLMKEGLVTPLALVNLPSLTSTLPGLGRIVEAADGSVSIGALVTLAAIADHPLIRVRYPALAEAVGEAASPQLRQVATLGGNLLQRPRCWYFRSRYHHCLRKGGQECFAFAGENQYHAVFGHNGCAIVHPSTSAIALVAFHAQAEFMSAKGAKRTSSLESFFVLPEVDLQRENDLEPGEILTAVVLPPSRSSARSCYLRQGQMDSLDWALVEVAAVLDVDSEGTCRAASIILGAVSPVPHRVHSAEAALLGKPVSKALAQSAGHAALEGAMPLSQNAYKLPILETLVARAILKSVNPA